MLMSYKPPRDPEALKRHWENLLNAGPLMARGRAVTSVQKRAVLNAVWDAWLDNPELRLGQLLECATAGLFYLEDRALAEAVTQFRR